MTIKPNWKAAAWAGVIAGLVFMMLEMGLVAMLQGQSPWGPPRMIGAIIMGKDVLPPPATFDLRVISVAMIFHMMLSILLGFVFGWLHSLLRMTLPTAAMVGAVFGLVVYLINFYLFTAAFPWFAMARGTISILAHAMFGLVLGCAYHVLEKRRGSSVESDRVDG